MVTSIIRLSRKAQRLHRRCPHWVKDLYDLVNWANVLQLVPTLSLIVCAPDHLFKRLPQTVRSKRSLHLTPVKFFFRSAALFVAYFLGRHQDLAAAVTETTARVTLVVLVPLLPLAMIVLAAVAYAGRGVMRLAPGGAETPEFDAIGTVLSFSTYRQLRWRHFLWGLLYLAVYLIIGWQVVQIVAGYSTLGTAWLLGALQDHSDALKFMVIVIAVGVVVIVTHELVLRPYAALLRAAGKRSASSPN